MPVRRRVIPFVLFLAAVGSSFLGSVGSLSAQTASNKAHKAEPANGIEEYRRAARSPEAVRDRYEVLREAQRRIEAASKNAQSSASSAARQIAPANR